MFLFVVCFCLFLVCVLFFVCVLFLCGDFCAFVWFIVVFL